MGQKNGSSVLNNYQQTMLLLILLKMFNSTKRFRRLIGPSFLLVQRAKYGIGTSILKIPYLPVLSEEED